MLSTAEYFSRMGDMLAECRPSLENPRAPTLNVPEFTRRVDELASVECEDQEFKTRVDTYLRALLAYMTEANQLSSLSAREKRRRMPRIAMLDNDMVTKRQAMLLYLMCGH